MDDGILFVERILLANDFVSKYADFDSFYDGQIAGSFMVVDGPPADLREEMSPLRAAARKEEVRAYLQQKYWPVSA